MAALQIRNVEMSRLFPTKSLNFSTNLQLVTRGCEALEVTPLRDGVGQPGFIMNEEGFVTELQRFCYAESGGLQLWARVVRLCGHSVVHLSPEDRVRLLRTAHKIHITVIPPDNNGKPRRCVAGLESLSQIQRHTHNYFWQTTANLTTQASVNETEYFSLFLTPCEFYNVFHSPHAHLYIRILPSFLLSPKTSTSLFSSLLPPCITMSSANIIVHGASCLTSSVNLSINIANKKSELNPDVTSHLS